MMNDLPAGFASRMKEMLGEEYALFLASYDNERGQALRLNPLKTEIQKAEGLPFLTKTVPWTKGGFYYEGRPGKHPLHEAGMYYMQEPSAMSVASLAGTACDCVYPEGIKGLRVLDLCAAPGGKSTQLAGMMDGKGLLISNEIMPDRAKILSQNMERMGVANGVVTNESPARLAVRFPYFFDLIVVDAPCSGEGMFRKEEQALTMWSEENVRICAERQKDILKEADTMLRAGGILVYSTCTFAPEEDEQNIFEFLKNHPDYEVMDMRELLGNDFAAYGFAGGDPSLCGSAGETEEEKKLLKMIEGTVRLWPHKLKGEGHYAAVLRKNGSAAGMIVGSGIRTKNDKTGGKKGNGRQNSTLSLWHEFQKDTIRASFLEKCKENADAELMLSGEELYLTPAGVPLTGLKVLRPGLHLGSFKKQRFEPSHALAMALTKEDVYRAAEYDADANEAYAFIRGESIPCDPELKGWTVVFLGGCSAGWGKASGGMLKNHYPKGLRKNYS